MSDIARLALDHPAGPSVFIDGDRGEWYVGTVATDSLTDALDEDRAACPCAPEPDALSEVWLYVNTDCNLECRHCYLDERSGGPSLDELEVRARDAIALGARTVYITGGEPLLRPDIASLIARVAEEARVCVLTNGTLVDGAFLDRLDRLGASAWRERLTFQVSVDGPRDVHEAQRGRDTFDRAVRGIGLLADWGAAPALTTALTSLTVAHAHEVTALAAGLGCRVHHLFLPHRSGGLSCAAALVPQPADLLRAIRRCREVAEATGVTLANDETIAGRVRRPGRRFVWCNGGSGMVAVGVDGSVYPCPTLVGERAFCEPAAGGLSAALRGSRMREFRCASVDDRPSCAACEYRYFCGGGCGAHAFREGGALHSAEPYCEVYRGLVEDHLLRESERLLAGVGGTMREGDSLRPVPASSTARSVYGCH